MINYSLWWGVKVISMCVKSDIKKYRVDAIIRFAKGNKEIKRQSKGSYMKQLELKRRRFLRERKTEKAFHQDEFIFIQKLKGSTELY